MYFAYCEAAFDAGYIHNFQIVWVKSADAPSDLPAASSQLPALQLGVPVPQLVAPPENTDHVMQVGTPFQIRWEGTLFDSVMQAGAPIVATSCREGGSEC